MTAALVFSARNGTLVCRVLSNPFLVYIGLISYSLYLWHWPVLTISRWTIGTTWHTFPFQILLMLVLASASYRYLEGPLRRVRWSKSRIGTIGYGITGVAVSASLLLFLIYPLHGKLFTGRSPELVAKGVGSLIMPHRIEGTKGAWQGETCVLSSNEDVGKNVRISDCTLGDFESAETRVLVVGNSFSAAFTHAFDKLVKEESFAVTITSSWGASVVPSIENNSPWSLANDYYWEHIVPSLTERLSEGDWLVMINDMASFSPKSRNVANQERLAQLEKGLTDIAITLSNRGIKLAVLNGLPFARDANCYPSSAIKQWFHFGGSRSCTFFSRTSSLDRRKGLSDTLYKLQDSGVLSVVDLFDVFCEKEVCDYETSNGIILYRDVWSHPSVEAARLSSLEIGRVLDSP